MYVPAVGWVLLGSQRVQPGAGWQPDMHLICTRALPLLAGKACSYDNDYVREPPLLEARWAGWYACQ